MKVEKRKIQEALARRIELYSVEIAKKYLARLNDSVKSARKNVKYYTEYLADKRKAFDKANAELSRFKKDGEVPQSFLERHKVGDRERFLAARLQKKIELCQDDSVNVTDTEFELL